MNVKPVDKDRRILPRWRHVALTARLGELDSVQSGPVPAIAGADGSISEKLQKWDAERTSAAAADLVAAAIVLDRASEARTAAEFLLRSESDATEAVKQGAEALLGKSRRDIPDEQTTRSAIRGLRRRLGDQPRNPIVWVELSRQYAIAGERDKARAAMLAGVALVEGNRYVLRSAARLFAHLDDPQAADDMLRTRAATRDDPWLLSAQIAASSVAHTRSPLIKRARKLVTDGSIEPRHLAELASALATVEYENGSDKAAKKLFRQSLIKPTDNAVAQAEWAARRIDGVVVPAAALEQSHVFEAKAWRLFEQQSWRDGVIQCEEWLSDEPYSSRPAVTGSYFALISLFDYQLAEKLARAGLKSNRNVIELLNNLTVALADQGRLDEAEQTLSVIDRPSLGLLPRIAVTATEGLLHFRRKRIALGRERYNDAIALAKRNSKEYLRVLALAHLVREEEIAHTSEADTVWATLPATNVLQEFYPDVAVFVEAVTRLRDLRRQTRARVLDADLT